MKSTGPEDLRAIGDPLAAEMIPGWRVVWQWCAPEDIGGALAMVYPDAKREMATIKVAPHPEGEDIGESIAHELVHATVRPLVELIPQSAASIGIEERIAERLGVLLARLWQAAPRRARAIVAGLRKYAPASARARISALAPGRREGRSRMDAKAVLAAITGQDEAKALEILTEWVAEQIDAAAGGPTPESNPEPPMNKDPNAPKPPGADPLAAPAAPGGDMRARMANLDALEARYRSKLAELEGMHATREKTERDGLVDGLRARLPADHKGLPATEKDILAAKDYADAKRVYDLAIRFAPEPDASRARGADGRLTAVPSLGAKPAYAAPPDLASFDPMFREMHRAVYEHEGPEAAERILVPARARLARDTAQGRN